MAEKVPTEKLSKHFESFEKSISSESTFMMSLIYEVKKNGGKLGVGPSFFICGWCNF